VGWSPSCVHAAGLGGHPVEAAEGLRCIVAFQAAVLPVGLVTGRGVLPAAQSAGSTRSQAPTPVAVREE